MIGDKYRIERELGRGGFGVVLRAVHLSLDQRVAIKVLTEGEGSTEAEWAEDAARFRREAKATAALKSTHAVRVLDVDVLDSGFPYIVMEYLEGKTLHELVYASQTPLPVEDAVDYVIQVLAALADAHSVGIVHRDLKPANVFLAKGPFGSTVAKVLDFGVSKMIATTSQRLTRTGAVVGTVAYMSPEQMLDSKRVDGRADLWSAGLVFFESLARMHPFGAASLGPKVVTAVLNNPLPSIRRVRPDVPLALETVIARMLEKDPDRRFATATEAALALAPFAPFRSRPVLDDIRRTSAPFGAAAPAFDPPPRAAARLRSKRRAHILGFILAFVTAAAILGIVALVIFYIRPPPLRRAPPSPTSTARP
jgi:serine/threonine-protein kinase